jgi:hypothetical protein
LSDTGALIKGESKMTAAFFARLSTFIVMLTFLKSISWAAITDIEVTVEGKASVVGQGIDIPVMVSNVEPGIVSIDLEISYDPALVQLNNVTKGTATSAWSVEQNIATVGSARAAIYSSAGLPLNKGSAAVLNFTTIAAGTCSISLQKVMLNEEIANNLSSGKLTINMPKRSIIATAGAGGAIAPSGRVFVNHGENETFTIIPHNGYQIKEVLLDGVGVTLPVDRGLVFTYVLPNVTANHTVAANFEVKTYTITASAGTGGMINPSGSVTVNHGASQTFTITPNLGFEINKVLVDGSEVALPTNRGAAFTHTFASISKNHNIAANFRQAVVRYIITTSIASGRGVINKNPDEADYAKGDIVELKAVPASRSFKFIGWGGAISGNTNPAKVKINANVSVSTFFVSDAFPEITGFLPPQKAFILQRASDPRVYTLFAPVQNFIIRGKKKAGTVVYVNGKALAESKNNPGGWEYLYLAISGQGTLTICAQADNNIRSEELIIKVNIPKQSNYRSIKETDSKFIVKQKTT